MEDIWWILCIFGAFALGYLFNDLLELLFNSRRVTQEEYENEQIRRLEASKKLREIEKEHR
tara:strand:+ start:741 stop:923 length:183 start_codon:yes stop_codon:yes gene_type:complete